MGDGFLFENLALRVAHAHRVLAVIKVGSDCSGGPAGIPTNSALISNCLMKYEIQPMRRLLRSLSHIFGAIAMATAPKDTPVPVDLNNIRIVKALGGTIDETELIHGLVFTNKVSHTAGAPTKVTSAKIGLIQFCLSAPKTDIEVRARMRAHAGGGTRLPACGGGWRGGASNARASGRASAITQSRGAQGRVQVHLH